MLHDSQTDFVFIPMAFRYHFPRFFKSLIAAFRAANVKHCELPYTSKKSRLWVRDYMPITVAVVAGAVMAICEYITKKLHQEWLESFSMALSMLVGMSAAVLLGLL